MPGRRAFVTGSAGGIGLAVARSLAADGQTVVGVDIAPQSEDVVAEALVADLGAIDDWRRVVADTGPVDILVNNAAVLIQAPFADYAAEDFDRTIAVNLRAPFLLAAGLAPAMMERGWRRIVNISSIGARLGGVADSAAYAATKAGLISLTKNLARTFGPGGVTANAIAPGGIRTEMSEAIFHRDPDFEARITAQIPLGCLAGADEVAGVAAFLASDAAGYVNGSTIDVNGGWHMA